ncbi:MAG: DegT/DnrJ/EryC1/StrS family aminotransferase [Spirochaetota bacterium]
MVPYHRTEIKKIQTPGNHRLPAVEGGTPVRPLPLPFSPPSIGEREIREVVRVLRSGWITRGEKCEQFERLLCTYTGGRHCVVLSSATAGLFLTLKVHGIGPGDEVVTTPYTFAATATAVLHAGARPVFADIVEDGFHLDPGAFRSKITSRTRAVIPVHFGGEPAPLQEIREIAGSRGILVIEDAAHALGASCRGERIGGGPNPAVFSFHAVKNVTTAEGGAVTTGDARTAELLRLYSLHGQTRDARQKLLRGGWRYDITVPGYKLNMTDLQAALGVAQLQRIEHIQGRREEIARRYGEALGDLDILRLPVPPPGTISARHLYPLRVDFSRLRVDRDAFIQALWAENVPSNVHYIPVHLMSYYREAFGYKPLDFPRAYRTFLSEMSLPLYPDMSDRDADDVAAAVRKLVDHYRTG